ncbi:MAG: four helix bundle protein [Paludibacteraceae bacterium]|nr:four helix bundle protein [Paludibacteraceae bacterium]
MEIFGYRKLLVYTKAKEIVKNVYRILRQCPKEEQYALCDQLRRSSVSITSNITEGTSRYSVKDKVRFLEIAYGSLMEVMSQLEIANDLKYIDKEELKNIEVLVEEEARLISGLRRSYQPEDLEP